MVIAGTGPSYHDNPRRAGNHEILADPVFVGPGDMAEHHANHFVIVGDKTNDRRLAFLPRCAGHSPVLFQIRALSHRFLGIAIFSAVRLGTRPVSGLGANLKLGPGKSRSSPRTSCADTRLEGRITASLRASKES